MTMITMPERKVPLKAEYDVLVAGAGLAGIAAAVYAARDGLKVGLLEGAGRPGGVPTSSILSVISGGESCDGSVVKGFFTELGDRLKSNPNTQINGKIIVDPEILTGLLLEILEENQIDTHLYTTVTDVVCINDTVKQVITHSKSGFEAYQAKLFVDATGDGDLAAAAGCKFEIGRENDGALQSGTLVVEFSGIKLENVPTHQEMTKLWLQSPRQVPIDHVVITLLSRPNGMASGFLNMTHVMNFNGLNEEDLTRTRFEGTKQAQYLLKFFKEEVPGFANAFIARTGESIGVRETRRIIGDYILTEEDVVNGVSFPDEIARCIWGIDVHSPDNIHTGIEISLNAPYGIPYRCITPKGVRNLYIAGRPISATHRAFSSSRINATCIAIGQAVGSAAKLAIEAGDTRKINMKQLQDILLKQNAVISTN